MRLEPNRYPYEFSITSDGEIEYINLYDGFNDVKDVTEFMKELIKKNEFIIGDGVCGEIVIKEKEITIMYSWISTIGIDVLTGVLDNEILSFPNE